ncbi:MAG: UPF0280 family protein [Elusimicrobiota bacterium]|nr:UPF0280 family protein [Elusimicrobiota bacterium]
MVYTRRDYRNLIKPSGLDSYNVKIEESDLHISTKGIYAVEARQKLLRTREIIKNYIDAHPQFREEMGGLAPADDMPGLIKNMTESSAACNVGPMASVAGAIAAEVGRKLCDYSPEVIVENGGDIFIKTEKERTAAVFAADSPLSMKIGIMVYPSPAGTGISTSSGRVGHSVSLGNAEAALCISGNPALADAAATAVGNMVMSPSDIEDSLNYSRTIKNLDGCLIIVGGSMGAAGNIEVVKI